MDRARAEGRVTVDVQGPLGTAAAFVDLARCVDDEQALRDGGVV